ncbi:MAG: hypothetical protein SGPRY_003079 [Prymnesium sp.]
MHVEILGSLNAINFDAMRSALCEACVAACSERAASTLRQWRRNKFQHRGGRERLWHGATWRSVTRFTLFGLMRDYGDLEQLPDYQIADLMTATRLRLQMQRFVERLRTRLRIRASTSFDLNDSD